MVVPTGMEISVEREPTTAAPIPAKCPTGSMARAFWLPNRMPIQKTVAMS
jgi:hypothetical protein